MPDQPKIVSDTLAAYLAEAPVDWARMAKSHLENGIGFGWFPPFDVRQDLAECVRELDRLITTAARLRGYLDQRHGSGCGDQGHDSGVKESNKLVTKIRKALGFTYPDRMEVHF